MIVLIAGHHWSFINFIISLLLLAGFFVLHHSVMTRTLIKRNTVRKYIAAAAVLVVVYMGIKVYQNYAASPGRDFENTRTEMFAPQAGPDAGSQNAMMSEGPREHRRHVIWEKTFMDFMIILLLFCVDTTATLLALYKRREAVLRKAMEKQETAKKGLYIRVDRKQVKVMPENITFIRGMNEYVCINFVSPDQESILVHKTMKQCLATLPEEFVQVQKSYIVNMNHVKSVETSRVNLEDGTAIPIGESYRKGLNEYLSWSAPKPAAASVSETSAGATGAQAGSRKSAASSKATITLRED